MKPLQLSMKAFGAFAEECRIDFTPFDKSGIYLITGETGAGKTTIFDAICYALYGTASGDVRDPKQFRSQYADPKQITCVELRFFCGNKQYLVNRTPPYLRAALRGSGMVEQKAEAELWEILPDKTAEKKEILCSGAQAVTDKVVELTGMDGKQFRQIVMIAQGEFRKFLLSSSVEKGKILRQLFHTQNCDKIQQILKERLDQQRAHVREQETQMLTLLHQASPAGEKQAELYEARLNFSGMAAAEELCDMLKTSAAELSEQAASQSEQVQEQQKAIESLLQEIEQGRQHNAVLKQLRQAEHAGQLPETDLFTILREWDTASGTALVPLMTEDGFSAAIATKTNLSAALSPDAVSGLCWLRGDNYPEQFSTESGSYTVSSAKTQLSAEKLPDGFHVTAAIFLEGEGDFEAASQEIARLCQAAFQETVSEYHADVFDVEPCLWSQCYKDMEQSDWKTAAGQMHFSVQVNPHKNML